jgi:hypothetical protein
MILFELRLTYGKRRLFWRLKLNRAILNNAMFFAEKLAESHFMALIRHPPKGKL